MEKSDLDIATEEFRQAAKTLAEQAATIEGRESSDEAEIREAGRQLTEAFKHLKKSIRKLISIAAS